MKPSFASRCSASPRRGSNCRWRKGQRQAHERKDMTIRNNALIHRPIIGFAGLVFTALVAGAGLFAADAQAVKEAAQPHAVHTGAPAKLVQLVRDATAQYINVNAATAAGYQPFLGCVSGQDHGAMGQHYVNSAYVGDGEIDVS